MLEFRLGHSKMIPLTPLCAGVFWLQRKHVPNATCTFLRRLFLCARWFSACPSCACKMLLLVSRHWPMGENPREHAVKVWERLARGISRFGQDAAMRRT